MNFYFLLQKISIMGFRRRVILEMVVVNFNEHDRANLGTDRRNTLNLNTSQISRDLLWLSTPRNANVQHFSYHGLSESFARTCIDYVHQHSLVLCHDEINTKQLKCRFRFGYFDTFTILFTSRAAIELIRRYTLATFPTCWMNTSITSDLNITWCGRAVPRFLCDTYPTVTTTRVQFKNVSVLRLTKKHVQTYMKLMTLSLSCRGKTRREIHEKRFWIVRLYHVGFSRFGIFKTRSCGRENCDPGRKISIALLQKPQCRTRRIGGRFLTTPNTITNMPRFR